ncbi:3-oxoacyl-ACP synthase III family protein [Streptomyces violaceusniger]|uniref:3-oxoacyl-ACP synthase III family protein n=1 Tax=Streptomyces violaceusniger TaxID=68280 RepID=UPI000996E447|nr:3-oxoacyl-ACP synthase [Streptomyces hygroscopicus]
MPIGIVSIGGYVPPLVVNNEQIGRWAVTEEGWIESRTGIAERRYAEEDVSTSELATRAALPLLKNPGVAESVGALVLATATPDQPQPATASFVQRRLGLKQVPSFDVNAVCSGFLYGLTVAEALMATRVGADYALVIGADKYSSIMDRADRRTVSLFGDGAGAVLLGRVPEGYGIQGASLIADGEAASLVRVEAGGTRRPLTAERLQAGEHFFRMEGRAVRDWGLQFVPKAAQQALEQAGMSIEAIDRVVFHQGNTRLVHSLAEAMGVEQDRLAITAPTLGNTAAASIPLTLARDHAHRPLRRGERVLLAAVGGGMTAAATVLTWY